MAALETAHLIKHFGGVHAVDRLSLAIKKGTITAIIGPNGSGKTTLINLLSGMLPADGGIVTVGGVGLRRMRSQDASSYGITRTFQNIRLFEQVPVLDNILVVLTERNVFGAMFERHGKFHLSRAEEILTCVGLWGKRHELAANLSYGQRKLLEIGRALAMNAEIFLFDEPFAGLFPEIARAVSNILMELKKEGKTIVLVEHDIGVVRKISDEVFVLDSGQLLAQGKPDEVLARREAVEAYLGD